MEEFYRTLTPLDELYLERADELAARALGNTSPNPPVGAVVVREHRVVGEGYHHQAGSAHAEVIALREAGGEARGATLYVSLEPCRHVGRTPPCALALLEAGIARVVAGALDPSGHGGAAELRERGIDVIVADDARARDASEMFARSVTSPRPYVAVKMAMSLDGAIASRPGIQQWLTSEAMREYVRELRIAHDAVMIGANTVRVDDPELTVRPLHDRLRPYVRIVACETEGVSPASRIFAQDDGYARSIVLAPGALAERLRDLRAVADVIAVGSRTDERLDLPRALEILRAHDVFSVLCEGGPRLAARLIAAGQVDRFYWAVAPLFLRAPEAVPVLAGGDFSQSGISLKFDRVERIGPDVMLSGTFSDV